MCVGVTWGLRRGWASGWVCLCIRMMCVYVGVVGVCVGQCTGCLWPRSTKVQGV